MCEIRDNRRFEINGTLAVDQNGETWFYEVEPILSQNEHGVPSWPEGNRIILDGINWMEPCHAPYKKSATMTIEVEQ